MKPKKGCTSAVMDDPVKDPLQLVKQVVLLIVEARTPDLSVKGRVEGPHCPIIRGRPAHKCSVEKAECVRASEFCYLAQKLWLNNIPICLDILMFPACAHGQEEAAFTEGTVTEFSRENALLIERWTIDGSRKRQDDVLSSCMLLQAVRSYLHFSQVSSWLYSTGGQLPGILTYRVYAPGEASSLDFSRTPDNHSFPLCQASFCHIRVRVSSMPRQASVPILVCFQKQLSNKASCDVESSVSRADKYTFKEASGKFDRELLHDSVLPERLTTDANLDFISARKSRESTKSAMLDCNTVSKKKNKFTKSLKEMSEEVLFEEVVHACDHSGQKRSSVLSDINPRSVPAFHGALDDGLTFPVAEICTKDSCVSAMKTLGGSSYPKFSCASIFNSGSEIEYEDENETSLNLMKYPSLAVSKSPLNPRVRKNKSSNFQLDQTKNMFSHDVTHHKEVEEESERERQGPRVRKKDGEKDLRIEQMKIDLCSYIGGITGEKKEKRHVEEDPDVQSKGREYLKSGKSFSEGKSDLKADLPMWLPQRDKKLVDLTDHNKDRQGFSVKLAPESQFSYDRPFQSGDVMSSYIQSREGSLLAKETNNLLRREIMEEELLQKLSNRLSLVTAPQENSVSLQKSSSKFQKTESSINKRSISSRSVETVTESQARNQVVKETASLDAASSEIKSTSTRGKLMNVATFSELTVDVSESAGHILEEDSDDTPVTSPDKSPESLSQSQMRIFESEGLENSSHLFDRNSWSLSNKVSAGLMEPSGLSKLQDSAVTNSRFAADIKGYRSSDQNLKQVQPLVEENSQSFTHSYRKPNSDLTSQIGMESIIQQPEISEHSESINDDLHYQLEGKAGSHCQAGKTDMFDQSVNRTLYESKNFDLSDQSVNRTLYESKNFDLSENSQNHEQCLQNNDGVGEVSGKCAAGRGTIADQNGAGSRKIFEENLLPLVSYDADSDSFRKVEQSFSSDAIHSPKVLFSCDISSSKQATSTKCIDFSVALESEFFRSKVNDMVGPEAIEKYMSKLAALYSSSASVFSPASVSSSSSSDADDHTEGRVNDGFKKVNDLGMFAVSAELVEKPARGEYVIQKRKRTNTVSERCLVGDVIPHGNINNCGSKINEISGQALNIEKCELTNMNEGKTKNNKNLVSGKPEKAKFPDDTLRDTLKEGSVVKDRIRPMKEKHNSSPEDVRSAVTCKMLEQVDAAWLQQNCESSASVCNQGHELFDQKAEENQKHACAGNMGLQDVYLPSERKTSQTSPVSESLTHIMPISRSIASSLAETASTDRQIKGVCEEESCSLENRDLPCENLSSDRNSSKSPCRNPSPQAAESIDRQQGKPQADGISSKSIESHQLTMSNATSSEASLMLTSTTSTSLHSVSFSTLPLPVREHQDYLPVSFNADLKDHDDKISPTCLSKVTVPSLVPHNSFDFYSRSELNFEPNLAQESQNLPNFSSDCSQRVQNVHEKVCRSCHDVLVPEVFPPLSKCERCLYVQSATVKNSGMCSTTGQSQELADQRSGEEMMPPSLGKSPVPVSLATSSEHTTVAEADCRNALPVPVRTEPVVYCTQKKALPCSGMSVVHEHQAGLSSRGCDSKDSGEIPHVSSTVTSADASTCRSTGGRPVVPQNEESIVPSSDNCIMEKYDLPESEVVCPVSAGNHESLCCVKCAPFTESLQHDDGCTKEKLLTETFASVKPCLSQKLSEFPAEASPDSIRALNSKSQSKFQDKETLVNTLSCFSRLLTDMEFSLGSDSITTETSDIDKNSKQNIVKNLDKAMQNESRHGKCSHAEAVENALNGQQFEIQSEGSDREKSDNCNSDVMFYISKPKSKTKTDVFSSHLLPSVQDGSAASQLSTATRSSAVSDDLEIRLRTNPGTRAKNNLDSFSHSGSPPLHGDPPGWSSVPPHRTVSTPSGMDRKVRGQDQKPMSRISVIQKQSCDNMSQISLQRMAARSASMIFNNRTGLPTQSSPAPLNRKAGGGFDYDPSLLNTRAIKNAFSCSKLITSGADDGNDSEEEKKRTLSTSAPASTNCLLGNFEESILNGRIDPVGTVEGFTAEIGASGSFCPKHLHLPVSAFFFALSDDNAPSPYLGHINLERVSKKGYHIPRKGTVQVTLFNPNKTVVKMFVVMYDLSDMPASSQTFIRQRTIYCPKDKTSTAPSYLRYLIHLRCASSRSGKIYLHTDIRLIFARNKLDIDSKTVQFELQSYTEVPQNPKYSPKK